MTQSKPMWNSIVRNVAWVFVLSLLIAIWMVVVDRALGAIP